MDPGRVDGRVRGELDLRPTGAAALIPVETLYELRRDFKLKRGWEYQLSHYPDRKAAKRALRWRGFWKFTFGASVVLFLGSFVSR